ncbi:MAG: ATP-dependent Clp protease proteolytic subunit [Akkermansiaceae bacterium]|jgi:ATP-dependent Clp protease protease subunit|nr:ATP-dependent Clp protease proteolytic subunit [Akkermansiaceae bacterium]
MKSSITRSAILGLALCLPLLAQEAAPADPAKAAAETPKENPEEAKLKEEQARLALENALIDERVKRETAEMRAEIARLKVEKELIAERIAMSNAKRQAESEEEMAKIAAERDRITREGEIAKAEAATLTHRLKAVQTASAIEITRLQGEIQTRETREKRANYADSEPVYLENPLREDGTLVISDRRIPLNGPITMETADFITDRIDYYNNKDRKFPIFIVIDDSPGGSVMAGYRILKSMEASDAPVYVVVKSFAASMAATIATLAKESYAYPNSLILHHQISFGGMGRLNLTQQRELVEEGNRWWARFGTPIAQKMGITTDELIKRMYEHASSGDWTEFGEEAQKLKWVNHVVSGIEESSFRVNPDMTERPEVRVVMPEGGAPVPDLTESIDEEGRPFMYLPRTNPKDVYFIYNPDAYYRLR